MNKLVRNTGRLQAVADWRAGEGPDTDLDFCKTCALYHACAMVGFGEPALSPLHGLMEHLGPFRAGSIIIHQGDPFDAVFAVRAGGVKTCRRGEAGAEQVLGFHLPGEVVGLKAIYPGTFPCDVVALDDTFLCRFPFRAMSLLAARQPDVQQHLFRLISRELHAGVACAGEYSADARMAAFLVNLAQRSGQRGASSTRLRLCMSRGDIANYLNLAGETVSRVLARFRDRNLIEVRGRHLRLVDPAALRQIGQLPLAA